jgi:hypothetical protein
MADPETGGVVSTAAAQAGGRQGQETGAMLRNLLRRISERSPAQEEPAQIRRGSSSSEQKQQHAYRENQEVLGKGAIAQVKSAHNSIRVSTNSNVHNISRASG